MLQIDDKETENVQKMLYNKLMINRKSITAIRIPKILFLLDDMSGSSLMTNTVENEFYKMIV